MRSSHRFIAALAIVLGLWVACTGALLQAVDLKTLLTNAPATDPNLQALREGLDGPPNFAVITTADNSAPALPDTLDLAAAFRTVVQAAREITHGAVLKFVEVRMLDGRPVGQVWSLGKLLQLMR
jgi:hypothetical protein